MDYSTAANDLLWDDYLRENAARLKLEHRAWWRNFLLFVALLAITLAGATALARFGPPDFLPTPHSSPLERITA